jgi:hypothetical protein
MPVAMIEILGWKEKLVGSDALCNHARSELKQRLRRGDNASPSEIKRLARQIQGRQLVSLHDVHDDAVFSITQILETTGAELRVSLNHSDPSTWRHIPNRGVR